MHRSEYVQNEQNQNGNKNKNVKSSQAITLVSKKNNIPFAIQTNQVLSFYLLPRKQKRQLKYMQNHIWKILFYKPFFELCYSNSLTMKSTIKLIENKN